MRKHMRGKRMRKKNLMAMLLSMALTVNPIGYTLAEETDSYSAEESAASEEAGIQPVLEETEMQGTESAEYEPEAVIDENEESVPEETQQPAVTEPETEVPQPVNPAAETQEPEAEETKEPEVTENAEEPETENAESAETPETKAEETVEPETKEAESTEAPGTETVESTEAEAPETEAAESIEAPETESAETKAQETEEIEPSGETESEETESGENGSESETEEESETETDASEEEESDAEPQVVPAPFDVSGDYIMNDVDRNVPAYYGGISTYQALPSAYPGSIDYLEAKYPALRKKGAYSLGNAFTAIGLAEFDLINDGTYTKDIDLSELQLAYFVYNKTMPDPLGGTVGDYSRFYNERTDKNYLNRGSNLVFVARRWSQWVGVVNESAVPYESADSVLQNGLADEFAYSYDTAYLKNVYAINVRENPDAVKQNIMEHGAVGIYYGHSADAVGVVNQNGRKMYTYYDTSNNLNLYQVMVVGWDDNFSKNQFVGETKPQNNGAWLIRNDWGDGHAGYMWMSYESASLSGPTDELSSAWVFDLSAEKEYDNNYQLDGGAWCDYIYVDQVANVFTTQTKTGVESETLKAVSLSFLHTADVGYKIEIYIKLTDLNDPTSGIKLDYMTTEGRTSYAGIYTVPLANEVDLEPGTTFSVVVSLDKEGYDFENNVIFQGDDGQVYWESEVVSAHNSFYWESNGNYFIAPSRGNFCIKAFTTNNTTKKEKYHISYELNGGVNSPWNPDSFFVKDGVVTLRPATRDGYRFAGWYTEPEFQNRITQIRLWVPMNYTLYAKWERKSVDAVANLRITRKTDSSVSLAWDPVNGVSGYNIYRYNSANDSWIYVKSVGTGNSTTITGLAPGVHAYNIKAYVKENGTVMYSKFSQTVRAALLKKPAIESVSAVNSKQIRIAWTSVAGASGYNLYRYNSTMKKFEYIRSVKGTAVYDTVEKPGTRYYYQVRAYYKSTSGIQYSAYSASRIGAALSGGNGPKVESLASNGIKLSWIRSIGANGYYVYRYNESTGKWNFLKNTTALSIYDSSAEAGKVYQYRIRPYCKMGDVYCFGKDSSAGKGMYVPKITGLTVSASGNKSATLTWEKNGTMGGYNIYRYDEASNSYKYVAGTVRNVYTDKNLTAGKSYRYRMRAYVKVDGVVYYGVYSDLAPVTIK